MSKKRMLIEATEGGESRVAVVSPAGILEHFYQERQDTFPILGNIYKARVMNVERSLQAAFLDLGLSKNGFLHASDLVPSLYREARPRGGFNIEAVLRPGTELMVQVVKMGEGHKGPGLTTNISLPGRYLVLMPYGGKSGVSKKIQDDAERQQLKKIVQELQPPSGMGYIIRTAGKSRNKAELSGDQRYLHRLWKAIEDRKVNHHAPCLLYQENDLVIRTLRDYLSPDIVEVLVGTEAVANKARDFLKIVGGRQARAVQWYRGEVPLFASFNVEEQVEKLTQRKVALPHGGSLVIDPTEALVAIDVNSGRRTDAPSPEETAFRTNIEAAAEAARQLRLRDLGGQVVIDFIDMQREEHKRKLEKAMRDAMKDDKARFRIGRITDFGMLVLTRQRLRPSSFRINSEPCSTCQGSGYIKSVDSICLDALRRLEAVLSKQTMPEINVTVTGMVALALLNSRRLDLVKLEEKYHARIKIMPDNTLARTIVVISGPENKVLSQ